MSLAVESWLARLDEATLARWRPAQQTPSRDSATAQPDGSTTLRLLRDGQPHTALRISGNVVRVEAASEPTSSWQARLPAADADALTKTLDDATR